MKYQLEIKGDGIIKIYRGPLDCKFDGPALPQMDMIRISADTDEEAIDHLSSVLKQSERHAAKPK